MPGDQRIHIRCAGLRLVFNLVILVVAGRRLPEFRGYRGRRFPGQQPPAPPRIAPRRLQLPPTFAQDQVSCDWWRAGHVTPCSPLIGCRDGRLVQRDASLQPTGREAQLPAHLGSIRSVGRLVSIIYYLLIGRLL